MQGSDVALWIKSTRPLPLAPLASSTNCWILESSMLVISEINRENDHHASPCKMYNCNCP